MHLYRHPILNARYRALQCNTDQLLVDFFFFFFFFGMLCLADAVGPVQLRIHSSCLILG